MSITKSSIFYDYQFLYDYLTSFVHEGLNNFYYYKFSIEPFLALNDYMAVGLKSCFGDYVYIRIGQSNKITYFNDEGKACLELDPDNLPSNKALEIMIIKIINFNRKHKR